MYTQPHQFEPLLPSPALQESLLAKAHDLARQATSLASATAPSELRSLLRGMNSYYTNRIEGQHTRPRDIEAALRQDFSSNPDLAARQRLAMAHIDAEVAVEQHYQGADGVQQLYAASAVQALHQELFARLPHHDRVTCDREPIVPGQLRTKDVSVGQHVAPAHASVGLFLARWATFYGGVRRGEASLLAAAAAHHRLGWIHPFVDGNGRVMRLHTHAVLGALGYTHGLWSPLRGFARSTDRYYALLADADLPRRGDLDGRGNLSDVALTTWIDYVLDVCLDQVGFMRGLLHTPGMEQRIAACLTFESQAGTAGVRVDALRPLHYLFMSGGTLGRGEFKSMTGLGERTASTVLSALLKRGLLKHDTPQGPVRFGLPQHALRFYFPALWPEAEAESWPDGGE